MDIHQTTQETISVNIPNTSKPMIVIIGGGFEGIELVRGLRNLDAHVILIDKNNHHTFQPLLYQVATQNKHGEEPVSGTISGLIGLMNVRSI